MSKLGLKVSNLSHFYGPKCALNNISFEVENGHFCALLGPNGAGKSTLYALLCRLFSAQDGEIAIDGLRLSENPRLALARMGIVFQHPTLDLDLTVRQNLNYFAGLHGISGKTARIAISEALHRLQMAEREHEKVRALNGGHRRRMEIARALIHKPSVLLLDEPTVGLDAQTRRQITEHVHDLASRDGLTVMWATHLVDEVWPDDRLLILHRGDIICDSVAKDISQKRSLAETFAELTESEGA
ncbi:MAG: ABC transporter ATP-binding protein [Rhizobiaceae bacterium]|nr:ABC transporter ATP-binding protein [Rhizobiaceae bacterium]